MSQKAPVLSGWAIQPWDVPETDPRSPGAESLANEDYLFLVLGRAHRFPFRFLLSSKQTGGFAGQ